MSALGKTFRIAVQNGTSTNSGTCTVKAVPWYIDPVRGKVYAAEQTWFNTTVNSSSTGTGSTVDNTANTYIWDGADIAISINMGSSATGDVTVRLETSTDGGTTWCDSNTSPIRLGIVTYSASSGTLKRQCKLGA
jgi:hypothetical protein